MRLGPLSVIAAFSVGVWVLALIGVASVASALASPGVAGTEPPAPLLSPAADGEAIASTHVPGLPAFPDSPLTAYNKSLVEGRMVTEVEYVAARPVAEVGEFYGSLFEQEGWTVTGESAVDGERTYSVELADRRASITLDPAGGSTEVRLELIEPVTVRGLTTDR